MSPAATTTDLVAELMAASPRMSPRMSPAATTTDLVIAELMAASPRMARMARAPRMARMARASTDFTDMLAQQLGNNESVQAFLGTGGRRMARRKSRKVSAAARKRQPCPPSKPYRSQVAPYRCLKHGSVAARKQGICPPRTDKSGRTRHYVSVTVPGRGNSAPKKRCVVAGGRLAKAAHAGTGCPPGKVQALVSKRVPTWIYERRADGLMYKTPKTNASGKQIVRTVVTSQCVRTRGKHAGKKVCTRGKVLASKHYSGTTPTGGSYDRQVTRCVKPSTAAKTGWTIIRTGHLAKSAYKRSKGARNKERAQNPKIRSKKKKSHLPAIAHNNPAYVKQVGQNMGWRAAVPSMTSLMAMSANPRMAMSLGSPAPPRRSSRRMA